MKRPINYELVGEAGIAWVIIQLVANLLFMAVTTPAFLISMALEKFFVIRLFSGAHLVSILVLSLLIVVFIVGTYKKKAAFAFLLLASVVLWQLVAVFGFIPNPVASSFAGIALNAFVVMNVVYFGITLLILLFMTMGIWNLPRQKYRIPVIASVLFLFIIAPITVSAGVSKYNHSGSISGRIYQPDGSVVTTEVQLYLFGQDVLITHGDPITPNLLIFTTGNYTIKGLPKSDHYYLWVIDSPHNLVSNGFHKISVKPFQETKLDLTLVPAGSISGRFLDDNEIAVPGAGGYRSVTISNKVVPSGNTIEVNPDGTYSKTGLVPGGYRIYSNLSNRQPFDIIIIESAKETRYDFHLSDSYP